MSEVLIYIFGDSHCKCFIHDRYNGGILTYDNITIFNKFKSSASMKGIVNSTSTLNYKDDMISTLKSMNLIQAPHKICVMKFGQVDIEHNYYYKLYYKNENIVKENFYKKLIQDYIIFIKFLKTDFPDIQFIVNGVNMPNLYDIQKYLHHKVPAMPKINYNDQFNNHFLFNNKLKTECEKNNICYFDLTEETVYNKKIKQEFIGNDNHFSGADIPNEHTHVIFLNKLFKTIENYE